MQRNSTSWFQGWKILVRCAVTKSPHGALMFTALAILKHMPPPMDRTSLHWPIKVRRTVVLPDAAFGKCQDANADATSRARRQIMTMNGGGFNGGKIMKNMRNPAENQETDESLAARYEISFDGVRYKFRQHHYDVFEDALRYAMAEHAKAGFLQDESFQPSWLAAQHPTDEDENMMTLHGIVYVEGHYLYGGYRYGQLCDAIAFAAGHPNL